MASKNKKRSRLLAIIVTLVLLSSILAQTVSASPGPNNPTPVNGRTLSRDLAGDTSAWIEIAQYQGYSLILRQEPLTSSLTTYYSSTSNNSYFSSQARASINNWFNSGLSSIARLRDFTVKSNAMTNLGSLLTNYVDGMSLPGTAARTGDDVAFALSYCEAAFFCCSQYASSSMSTLVASSSIARSNCDKLLPRYVGATVAPAYWLRTPGNQSNAAGCVAYTGGDSSVSYARAYQHIVIGAYAHYRPALWVGSGIFDDVATTVTLSYNANGGTGAPPPQTGITPNTTVIISSTIPTLANNNFLGWSTNASATSPQYQPSGTILMSSDTMLYAVWQPAAEGGRILPPDKTGDNVNWLEIARNGNYSLIVRTSYININSASGSYGNPAYQYTAFGTSTSYASSSVRTRINAWFNGTASTAADNLPAGARMRNFTMSNNASSVLGTCCNPNVSLINGLSAPGSNKVGTGDDVAFALSYSEAANYCSTMYFMRELPLANQPSSAVAIANYNKMSFPESAVEYYYMMWLRSVGDVSGTVGELARETTYNGRVFQEYTAPGRGRGLVYPALWVDSAIFDEDTTRTVTGQVFPLAAFDLGYGSSFLSQHDVVVELRSTFQTPASSALSTKAVLTGYSGYGVFTFQNVPYGDYILYIHRPGYLARAMPVSIAPSSPAVVTLMPPGTSENGVFRLWWGDSNGDLSIESKDYMMIMELVEEGVAYPDPRYNAACDLNADGNVNTYDLMMLYDYWDRNIWQYPGAEGVDVFS